MSRLLLCLAALVFALLPAGAQAPADGKLPAPTALTLMPAAAPVPALRYQLLTETGEFAPGNAALAYHRAIEIVLRRPEKARFLDKISDWTDAPAKELDDGKILSRKEARALAASYDGVLQELAQASLCRHCDWGLDFRKEGLALYVPEAQDIRTLALIVDFTARVHLLDGQYDRALRTLRSGFAMARNTGEGPTLIHAVVGLAVTQVMAARLEELIQARGAPNCYWALATLPRPFIDLRRPLRGERRILVKEFPELAGLTVGPLSQQEVEGRLVKVWQRMELLVGGKKPSAESLKQLAAVHAKERYPAARKALRTAGVSKQQLDAMPPLQVFVVDALGRLRRLQDDLYKWMYLPYPEAHVGLKEATKRLNEAKHSEDALVLPLYSFVPQLVKLQEAAARAERVLALLRCVEAIRLYAAAHDGKLPRALADIRAVPVPLDPFTGAAFVYRLADGAALLTGPPPTGEAPAEHVNVIHYRLTVKR